MRFSNIFIPTTKEAPKDAVLASHQYLVRGGFVSQVSAGIYNFLPLGNIVLDRVKSIVKEELDSAGCNEVILGFVTPASLWEESGRFARYGKELLRFKDRKNLDFVLGPTHEEMMVNLVRGKVTSYKDLPLNLYQINTKFRDEARPRFGLLRGREFLMKDGYSFHPNEDDMVREFALMQETYSKIFKRLGLDFRVVEADSGAIGGEGSREFMVLADSGEDTIIVCDSCNYSANIEAGTRKPRVIEDERPKADFDKFKTENIKTIDEVSEFFRVSKSYCVKAIAKKAIYDDRDEIVIFFVRGDDELEETKALNSCSANEIIDATEEELGGVAGYIGPVGMSSQFYIDSELKGETSLICGANEKDFHFVGVDLEKLAPDAIYKDLIAVKEGDCCPKCSGKIHYTKGIEVGHIFQLGTKYSESLNANFLDEHGKSKPFVMGTYGIGVSRLLSAIIEQNHDEKGAIWTKETAPFLVDIVVSNAKKEHELNPAIEIYEKLKEAGIDVILDDRKDRFGFKMKDFELIGFPYAIVVGKKIKDGLVEVVKRDTLEKIEVDLSDFNRILEIINC